ncbi:MAG: hypothetical protein HC842_00155 [Cytophagales bacterium]|nr:hypothetical protein [Cytophagales bacterium]
MKQQVIDNVQARRDYLRQHRQQLVMDGDTHPTRLDRLQGEVMERFQASPNYYQGRPIGPKELLAEMKTERCGHEPSMAKPSRPRLWDRSGG